MKPFKSFAKLDPSAVREDGSGEAWPLREMLDVNKELMLKMTATFFMTLPFFGSKRYVFT